MVQCVVVCSSVLLCVAVNKRSIHNKFVTQESRSAKRESGGCARQVVAVCCSLLQSVAVCCSLLQSVAVCCSLLQSVALCCSVLQCVARAVAVRDR